MDMQHYLCGMATDRLRSVSLPLPRFVRGMPATGRRMAVAVRAKGDQRGRRQGGRAGRKKHLPLPTGKYTVGCVDIMSDHTVNGTFMRVYYPTNPKDVFRRQRQWPLWLPRKRYGHGYVYFRRKNKLFNSIFNLVGGDVYVPVLWQAPVISDAGQFPVIIFTHGLGGNRTTYTTLCSDLASHGFIVAALEHRDGSASLTYCFKEPQPSSPGEYETEQRPPTSDTDSIIDYDKYFHPGGEVQEEWLWYDRQEKEDDYHIRNKQVHMRVVELQRAVDLLTALNDGSEVENVLNLQFDLRQLQGKLDMDRLSVVGHSFGGATTVAALAEEPRFKCGVGLDSWMLPLEPELYGRVHQPILMVNTETFQWALNVRDMYRLNLNSSSQPHRRLLTIRGTCHQSMTDFQFLLPGRIGRMMELRNNLPPKVAMSINSRSTRGFLAKHLDIPDSDHHTDILTGQHPHILCGTTVDLINNLPLPP